MIVKVGIETIGSQRLCRIVLQQQAVILANARQFIGALAAKTIGRFKLATTSSIEHTTDQEIVLRLCSSARQGKRVACFDSHYVAGGCATQFARRNESGHYRFDIGLHYIGDCGPEGAIPRILRALGVEQEFVSLDPEGFDVLCFPDFEWKKP